MNMVLRLDASGLPIEWVNHESAAQMIVVDQVLWSMGDIITTLHGGINAVTGVRSKLDIPSIIATQGTGGSRLISKVPHLSNKELFSRDRNLCLYCGESFHHSDLTRDHVKPVGQGGPNVWNNVVSACKRCNNAKGCRTPAQAKMPLLAVPYTPNYAEWMVLRNRNILADQMDFLQQRFKVKPDRFK